MGDEEIVLEALAQSPRWHVIHWGTPGTSTLLCLWVAGRETLVPVDESHVTYDGLRQPVLDGELTALLRTVQAQQDAKVLQTAEARAACDWLLEQWAAASQEGGVGHWRFPRGGYIRWVRNGSLHIEASEGGAYEQALPEPLRDVLVDLGWNPPDGQFRNCWLQPGPDDHAAVAERCVLTPVAAFGYASPPPLAT